MLTSATPNEPRPVDDGAAASGGGSHQSLDRVDTIKLRSEKGPRFWLIFLAICVSAFLAALELASTLRLGFLNVVADNPSYRHHSRRHSQQSFKNCTAMISSG